MKPTKEIPAPIPYLYGAKIRPASPKPQKANVIINIAFHISENTTEFLLLRSGNLPIPMNNVKATSAVPKTGAVQRITLKN